MFPYKTIRDVDLAGKRVFVRVDFNVPLDSAGTVSDDSRIVAALPTIRYLIEHKAKVILASHLGRPEGKVDPKYSLLPVALVLAKKLNVPVIFAPDCIGYLAEGAVAAMEPGTVVLLENLRFHKGEEANEKKFCAALAKLGDFYVNDAFGTAHRAHASTEGMAKLMQVRLAGFLMERELEFLGEKTKSPKKPFVVILGGAKVSDKIKVIEALLGHANTMLIGGAMAYTFMKAQGMGVGASRVELEQLAVARKAIKLAEKNKVKFIFPEDHIVTNKLDFEAKKLGDVKTVVGNIPAGWIGIDIGPKARAAFAKALQGAKTILWNGPMGVFEISASAEGTMAVARAVADCEGISIIGGGDSVKAIKSSGVSDQVTFMSTGGGASLEFLEGKVLPGVAVLDKNP